MNTFRQFYESILSKKDALRHISSTQKTATPWYKRVLVGSDTVPTQKFGVPNASLAGGGLRSLKPETKLKIHALGTHKRGDGSTKSIAKVANIPLDSVITRQSTVNAQVLKWKTKGTWGKHQPRLPMFLKLKTGQHMVLDGNHRTIMRKARNFTHIRGHVIDPDEK